MQRSNASSILDSYDSAANYRNDGWVGEGDSCDTSLPNRVLHRINDTVPKAPGSTLGTHQRCFWNHGPLLQPVSYLTKRHAGDCAHKERATTATLQTRSLEGGICMCAICLCVCRGEHVWSLEQSSDVFLSLSPLSNTEA